MIMHGSMSHHRKLAAALAVVPLLFAACGGSSGGATAAAWCDFADESDVVAEIFSSLGANPSDLEAGISPVDDFVHRPPTDAPDDMQ